MPQTQGYALDNGRIQCLKTNAKLRDCRAWTKNISLGWKRNVEICLSCIQRFHNLWVTCLIVHKLQVYLGLFLYNTYFCPEIWLQKSELPIVISNNYSCCCERRICLSWTNSDQPVGLSGGACDPPVLFVIMTANIPENLCFFKTKVSRFYISRRGQITSHECFDFQKTKLVWLILQTEFIETK